MTAIVPTSPANIWTAPGPEQPQGLQAMGNYFQWDVTAAVAGLIAQGAPISFALVNDMASSPLNAGLRWASRETPGNLRAPFLQLDWTNQSVAQSVYMADTGNAQTQLQAVITAVAAQLGGSGPTTATIVSHVVTGSVTLSGASAGAFDTNAAAALANGLAADLLLDAVNIRVGPALPLASSRRRRLLGGVVTPGVEVTFQIAGLHGPTGDGAPPIAGQLLANQTAEGINNLLLSGNSNAAALLRRAGLQFAQLGQGQPPAVWRVVSIQTPITPFGLTSDSASLLGFISSGALKARPPTRLLSR